MKFVITTLFAIVLVASVSGLSDDDDKKHDWRNEFDYLLMKEIEEKMDEMERHLLHLSMQVNELEKTKKKELKEQILRELTVGSNFAQDALGFMERQQKRTDLDLFERYNYDMAVEALKLLIKDFAKLAEKVKNIEPAFEISVEYF